MSKHTYIFYPVIAIFLINLWVHSAWLVITGGVIYISMFVFLLFRNNFYPAIPIIVGGTCNQVALWSNGFRMPVIDNVYPAVADYIHTPMTAQSHFKMLCDIYPFFHGHLLLSFGDLTILIGLPIALIIYFVLQYKRLRNSTEQSTGLLSR